MIDPTDIVRICEGENLGVVFEVDVIPEDERLFTRATMGLHNQKRNTFGNQKQQATIK